MSYSLNQLLDATGINELTGSHLKKTASERESFDLSKLAQRCRDAAETPAGEIDPSAQGELVEKTAAIAVIHKTLSEIRDFEKTSSYSPADRAKYRKLWEADKKIPIHLAEEFDADDQETQLKNHPNYANWKKGLKKKASVQGLPPDAAVFIKKALAEGHSPEEIAKFLQNRG